MALTRTYVGIGVNAGTTVAARTATLNCGTVTAGDLLVIFSGIHPKDNDASATVRLSTPTKSAGTATIGTVTKRTERTAVGFFPELGVWTVPVTGSGTLTLSQTTTNNNFGTSISVVKYTGHDATTPTGGIANQAASGAQLANSTLSAAPSTGDETLAFGSYDTDTGAGGWTPASGWTEVADRSAGGSDWANVGLQVRAASTSTTVDWPNSLAAAYDGAGVAVVIKVAASGGTTGTGAPTTVRHTAAGSGSTTAPSGTVGSGAPTLTRHTATGSGSTTAPPGGATVTDDFNRANGSIGSNWTKLTPSDAIPTIVSNQCIGPSPFGAALGDQAIWTADDFTDDQWAEADISIAGNAFYREGEVWIRTNAAGTSGYVAVYCTLGGGELRLYDATFGSILDSASVSGSGTHTIKIEAIGSSIVVSFDGTPTLSVTDSTYTTGYPGIGFYQGVSSDASAIIDNFSAGPTVGGGAPSGSGTPTMARHTAAGTGTATIVPVTGTGALTLAAKTAVGLHYDGLFPTTVDVSNKRFLDQNGDPWFGTGDTPWSLVAQITEAEITSYLEAVAALGINFILFNAPEPNFTSNSPNDANANSELPFTGTRFQSPINDGYWTTVDHAVSEALRLGITCLICPQYIGYNDTEGWGAELTTAYSTDPTKLSDYGAELEARYGSYPNIMWIIGHDRISMTTAHKQASKLIADELSGLKCPGSHYSTGVYGSDGWTGTGITWDFDTLYTYSEDVESRTATAYASGTTLIMAEGKYEQEQSIGIGNQLLREQMWEAFVAGATASLFGNNPRWHFESGKELYGFSGTWEQSLSNPTYNQGTVHIGHMADFMSANAVLDTIPDAAGTFVTAGTGAYGRFDTTVGVTYASGTGSITLDTTELAGTSNVKIRRFDPTDGSYTTVTASEAQNSGRVLTYPGTNSDGGTDWVYLVELASPVGTGAPTLVRHTATGAGSTAVPGASGSGAPTLTASQLVGAGSTGATGASATTLATRTATGAGSTGATGTSATTLAARTATGAGSTGATGTSATTLAARTATGAGSTAVPGGAGSGAAVLAARTATGTGSTTGVIGTSATTLAARTATGSGSTTGITGTSATTLSRHAATGSGSTVVPGASGSGALALSRHTATGAGTQAPPAGIGSGSPALAARTASGTGSTTIPAATGTGSPTLTASQLVGAGSTGNPGTGSPALVRHAATGSGATVAPGGTGTGSPTLAARTATGTGSTTSPSINGTGSPICTRHTATGSGSTTGLTGTAAVTLIRHSVSGAGSCGATGDGSPTSARHAATGSGATTLPVITGSGALLLARHTAVGREIPPVAPSRRTLNVTEQQRVLRVQRQNRTRHAPDRRFQWP